MITISHLGYIKRTPLTEFRRQGRGGIGSRGSITREEDFIEHLYVATMHNTMLFFTEKGRCYWLKVWQIPEGTRTAKGRAIQNLILIEPDDRVRAYINVRSLKDEDYIKSHYILLATRKGVIKKTLLESFSRPRQKGINAVTVREGDQLLTAALTNGTQQILLAVRSGRALRFPEEKVRAMGRTAAGVRGITLSGKNDEVVDMVCIESEAQTILVVSEKGYGKRSSVEDYRITNRGGKGVKTINITEKTGALIAMKAVTDAGDLMIINRSGVIIRMPVSDIRVMGRATQGVRLINLREGDSIAAVTYVETNDANGPQGEEENRNTNAPGNMGND